MKIELLLRSLQDDTRATPHIAVQTTIEPNDRVTVGSQSTREFSLAELEALGVHINHDPERAPAQPEEQHDEVGVGDEQTTSEDVTPKKKARKSNK